MLGDVSRLISCAGRTTHDLTIFSLISSGIQCS
jgi:hypothetical protein